MNIRKFVKSLLLQIPYLRRAYSLTYSVPNVPGTMCGGINGEIENIKVFKTVSQEELAEEIYQVIKKLLSSPGFVSISMTSGKKTIPIIYFGMKELLPLTCEVRDLETGRPCSDLSERIIKKWNAEYPKLREELGHMG